MDFLRLKEKLINQINLTKLAVIATANKNGIVSTSQVCIVSDDLNVYFQTDKTFEKIKNINENPNISLYFGAVSLKGKAEILGHPTKYPKIAQKIKEKHPKTFEHFTNLPNEVLVKVKILEAKIWGVDNNKPVDENETITIVNFNKNSIKTIICDKM